jgi:hypothetical protein
LPALPAKFAYYFACTAGKILRIILPALPAKFCLLFCLHCRQNFTYYFACTAGKILPIILPALPAKFYLLFCLHCRQNFTYYFACTAGKILPIILPALPAKFASFSSFPLILPALPAKFSSFSSFSSPSPSKSSLPLFSSYFSANFSPSSLLQNKLSCDFCYMYLIFVFCRTSSIYWAQSSISLFPKFLAIFYYFFHPFRAS